MKTKSIPSLALVLLAACGDVKSNPDAPVNPQPDASMTDAAPSTFTVGGTVTGFAGSGLVLQLNGGSDLTVSAEGAFNFPVQLGTGAAYTVTVRSSPLCPERRCSVTGGGTGTVGSANVTSVEITCVVPKIRLASVSWGDDATRVTDDLAAISNNATASPRIIAGAATLNNASTVDGLALDPGRNLIYVAARYDTPSPAYGINVYAGIGTATGNIAPMRRFTISGATGDIEGIELDAEGDRLYVSQGGDLHIFSTASTVAAGVRVPTATINLTNSGPITYDRRSDRLYVSPQTASLLVFDNARTLTSASVATRTVTWTSNDFPRSLAIDSCRDRIYIGNRNVSPNGHNIYVFDAASTLTGAINIEAGAARLVVPNTQVMSMAIDSLGALYFWNDSPNQVRIINTPHLLSGPVTVAVDKSILGVVASGYGLDVASH